MLFNNYPHCLLFTYHQCDTQTLIPYHYYVTLLTARTYIECIHNQYFTPSMWRWNIHVSIDYMYMVSYRRI